MADKTREEINNEKEVLKAVFSECSISDKEFEILHTHIEEHKYFLNEDIPFTVNWDQAIFSWYDNIFRPVRSLYVNRIVSYLFPTYTKTRFYFEVADHWHYMKKNSNIPVYIEEAVMSYIKNHSERKLLGRVLYSFIRR